MNKVKALLLGLFFLIGCTNDKLPEGMLSQQRMIAVLTDVHLVDSYLNTVPPDSVNYYGNAYYRTLFKKHHTDSTQLRKSIKYYSSKPEQMDEIYTQVLETLNKRHAEAQKIKQKEAAKTKKSVKKEKTDSVKIETDTATKKPNKELKRRLIMRGRRSPSPAR